MADINTIVNDFLRDAQYRIALYAVEVNDLKKDGMNYDEPMFRKAELILWMDLLYDSRHNFDFGYNFLSSWDERDIQAECEYLRKVSMMTNIPWLTFAGYSPQIRNVVLGTAGLIFPSGSIDDILIYTSAGNPPTAQPFPQNGGMENETISDFFT